MSTQVVPFKDSDEAKQKQVEIMFDQIAGKYDFLNRFLSLGIDMYWRKKSIKMLLPYMPSYLLDVATGTCDLALDALKILSPKNIVGIDISAGMLQMGQEKLNKNQVQEKIKLQIEDARSLSFADDTFDNTMCAFGVRNFENLEKGLAEMYRVTKSNGTLLILEFSKPTLFPFNKIYGFYFRYILPFVGKLFSKSSKAYSYLHESVQAFPQGEEMVNIINKIGYKNVVCKPLTLGIVSVYFAEK